MGDVPYPTVSEIPSLNRWNYEGVSYGKLRRQYGDTSDSDPTLQTSTRPPSTGPISLIGTPTSQLEEGLAREREKEKDREEKDRRNKTRELDG